MAKKYYNKNLKPEEGSLGSESAPKIEFEDKLDFDAWYAMREGRIPRHHYKEILKADFKGRGLGQCESMNDFDAALKKYGVKLD